MVRLSSVHQKLAVPTSVVASGLVELDPVPGGRFEGEVPDHVAKFLQSIQRHEMEYVVESVKAPAPKPPAAAAEPAKAPEPAKAAEPAKAPEPKK